MVILSDEVTRGRRKRWAADLASGSAIETAVDPVNSARRGPLGRGALAVR